MENGVFLFVGLQGHIPVATLHFKLAAASVSRVSLLLGSEKQFFVDVIQLPVVRTETKVLVFFPDDYNDSLTPGLFPVPSCLSVSCSSQPAWPEGLATGQPDRKSVAGVDAVVNCASTQSPHCPL
jgi:hypothetical protein